MTISPDILAKQQAYAARPFAVAWSTSHFSGTFRFDTLEEAFQYINQQWRYIRDRVARERYTASNLWNSWLETPEGRVRLTFVLLADDVSSY